MRTVIREDFLGDQVGAEAFGFKPRFLGTTLGQPWLDTYVGSN